MDVTHMDSARVGGSLPKVAVLLAGNRHMGGRVRHRLSLSSTIAAVLLLCPLAGAVAAARAQTPDSEHQEMRPSSPPCTHEHTVSAVARRAQRVCGGAPAAEALLAVGLQPGEAAGDAGRALAGLGLRTALDLRIIGGRPEGLEVMAALREAGLSVGDRSKIRLLLEEQAHLDHVVVRDRSFAADATMRDPGRCSSARPGKKSRPRFAVLQCVSCGTFVFLVGGVVKHIPAH